MFSDYLNQNLSFDAITKERQAQLLRISQSRGRQILVYAADINKSSAPISIDYSDIIPFNDQLSNLNGTAVDVILETPGGDGTVAEDMVRLLRGRFQEVAFIIPGWAKSAGTIIAMSGDEILMGPASALGPIDAQLFWQGKVFSAEALLEGMNKIKQEVVDTGMLNKAYIPILQNISPGELQSAQNSLDFARRLVTDWLATYKFKNWAIHRSSTKQPVTPQEKKDRAKVIADDLCSHQKWLSHGRSIKIDDLRTMRLEITDFTGNAELGDAITRYHTLLQMTFATNVYKVFETSTSQIYRLFAQQGNAAQQGQQQLPQNATNVIITTNCPKCGAVGQIQANLGVAQPLQPGNIPFPPDNKYRCATCGMEQDLTAVRQQVEGQTGKKIVA